MLQVQARGGANLDDFKCFSEILATVPKPAEHEVLVRVRAASVNPVDSKIRMRTPDSVQIVLGYDTCGVVEKVGEGVTTFKKGDSVFFMGQAKYPGSFSEYQLADSRTIAFAPQSLSDAETAVLPVASITAYESLFVRLGFTPAANANNGKTLLIIGGAGGVGSMAIQLAKWSGFTVIATASREETTEWCSDLGADYILNHHKDMAEQLRELDMQWVDAIFCTTHFSDHWGTMAEIIKPQGNVAIIDDPAERIDIRLFKTKSARICWEFALTRTMYDTDDLKMLAIILTQIAELIDTKKLRSPLTETHYGLNAKNVQLAHLKQESNTMVGKQAIVIKR